MTSWVQNAWTKLSLVTGNNVASAKVAQETPDLLRDFLPEIDFQLLKAGPGGPGHRKNAYLSGRWIQILYACTDLCCVVGSGILTFLLRFSPGTLTHVPVPAKWSVLASEQLAPYIGFLFLYVVLILIFCQWQGLYRTVRTRTSFQEFLAVVKAVSLSTLLLTAFVYLSGVKIVSRQVVFTSFLLNIVVLAAWRYLKRQIVIDRVKRGIGVRNAVIVGAGRVGKALARQFEENHLLGYRFVGFLDGNHSHEPGVLGKLEDLSFIARSEFVDDVFITIPSDRELVKRIAVEARQHKLTVKVVPELYDGLGWQAPIDHVGAFPVMEIHWQALPTFGFFVKRIFDVVLSLIALVIVAPLLVVLAVWIKLDSPGPILYRSRRVGRKGRVFTCYKLRSMVVDADGAKESLRHRNERQGPFFKISDDPRITPLGKRLRKYSLDELPQIINVLTGDMSLVGPRPHPLDDYKRYDLDHLRRLDVKPGITGLWQVTAREDPSFEKSMELDLSYIERWSVLLDLRILAGTLPSIWRGKGQ